MRTDRWPLVLERIRHLADGHEEAAKRWRAAADELANGAKAWDPRLQERHPEVTAFLEQARHEEQIARILDIVADWIFDEVVYARAKAYSRRKQKEATRNLG